MGMTFFWLRMKKGLGVRKTKKEKSGRCMDSLGGSGRRRGIHVPLSVIDAEKNHSTPTRTPVTSEL